MAHATSAEDRVEIGHAALAQGAWEEARASFEAALEGGERASGLPGRHRPKVALTMIRQWTATAGTSATRRKRASSLPPRTPSWRLRSPTWRRGGRSIWRLARDATRCGW